MKEEDLIVPERYKDEIRRLLKSGELRSGIMRD